MKVDSIRGRSDGGPTKTDRDLDAARHDQNGEVITVMTDQPNHGVLSLEQIEQDPWGDPPADATRLIRTTHELRRKPVAALTPEDLRLLIGQQIGVEVLVPHALAKLAHDPLVEGDFYPGDLLVTVMRLPVDYWNAHPEQATTLRKITGTIQDPDPNLKNHIDSYRSSTEQHT
jgi:hypothetical protein